MIKHFFILLLYFALINSSYSHSFNEKNLPDIIRKKIEEYSGYCKEIRDNDGKEGKYDIGNSLRKISIINHEIEYIVYFLDEVSCSSAASFGGGSAGHSLYIFANLNNQWQRIYSGTVFSYRLICPGLFNGPADLEVEVKGDPGFSVNRVEYEWDAKKNSYIAKTVKEDVYNDLLKNKN